MRETVRRRYEAMARSGEIVPDATQRALVDALDTLIAALAARAGKGKSGPLRWLRSIRADPKPLRGLYIWGDVGRGKTLLMDLFFAAASTKRKRRVHFHQFMGEVHDRIAALRNETKNNGANGGGPIAHVALALASEIELLCFDEFAVYDIADAMILGRLFEQLFRRGVTVVATTNVAPDDLYKDGLSRAHFLPFIALLKERMEVFHLDAPRDYRLDSSGTERRYVTPLGPEADSCLSAHFRHFSGLATGQPQEIASKGRRIVVPEAADGIARFSFDDLCSKPLGASDYLKIADAFHTIVLADVPVLAPTRRNEAKRLINLIDTLYDRHVRFIVSAEAEPERLWQGKDGAESFEFARTASRLIEMQSDAYWDAATANAEMKKARAVRPGPDQ
jgi:cell division protein ZapE